MWKNVALGLKPRSHCTKYGCSTYHCRGKEVYVNCSVSPLFLTVALYQYVRTCTHSHRHIRFGPQGTCITCKKTPVCQWLHIIMARSECFKSKVVLRIIWAERNLSMFSMFMVLTVSVLFLIKIISFQMRNSDKIHFSGCHGNAGAHDTQVSNIPGHAQHLPLIIYDTTYHFGSQDMKKEQDKQSYSFYSVHSCIVIVPYSYCFEYFLIHQYKISSTQLIRIK